MILRQSNSSRLKTECIMDALFNEKLSGIDAEGNEKELSVVYRLYVHAKTEGVALVISIHGYG